MKDFPLTRRLSDASGTNDNFRTSADEAYQTICDKILSGELPPGAKLTRRDMARVTGVSTIPVIEALHRLEDEGLAESQPRWGSCVIELTRKVIEDRYAVRKAIECQIARILAKRLTGPQREQLQLLAQKLDRLEHQAHARSYRSDTNSSGSASISQPTGAPDELEEELWESHYEFHMSLARLTGHESLIRALRLISLFNLLERAESSTLLGRKSMPPDNHQRLLTVISSSDPDASEAAMRTHVRQSGSVDEDR